jgi:hypothetical protein
VRRRERAETLVAELRTGETGRADAQEDECDEHFDEREGGT